MDHQQKSIRCSLSPVVNQPTKSIQPTNQLSSLFLSSRLMEKIVFITGASSGFGEACACKFAQNRYHLILNGRRLNRLEELKKGSKKNTPSPAICCLLM